LEVLVKKNGTHGTNLGEKREAKISKPCPPMLTELRTPKVPVPKIIPHLKPARKAPKSMYDEKSKEQIALDLKRRERRRGKLNKGGSSSLSTVSQSQKFASMKTLNTLPSVERFILPPIVSPHPLGYIPDSNSLTTLKSQNKHNVAALLRESALFLKKEEEKKSMVQTCIKTLVDPVALERLEKESRASALEREEMDKVRKKLQVQLIHEDALIAKETSLQQKWYVYVTKLARFVSLELF
jgi:hypothetical protein